MGVAENGSHRKNNTKSRTFSLFGTNFHTTAKLRHQGVGDSKPQTDTCCPFRQFDKTVKHVLQLVFRYSFARIRYIKTDLASRHLKSKTDITFFGMLETIGQQVRQHLCQSVPVRTKRKTRTIVQL